MLNAKQVYGKQFQILMPVFAFYSCYSTLAQVSLGQQPAVRGF